MERQETKIISEAVIGENYLAFVKVEDIYSIHWGPVSIPFHELAHEELITKKGKRVTELSAYRTFKKMIKAAHYVTFKAIRHE